MTRAVLALALGTQLPDLVDKPLAWYLDVLPFGPGAFARILGRQLRWKFRVRRR